MGLWMLSRPARTFTLVWSGQAISLLGSAMTSFALTVWIWQSTGRATSVALMELCSFLPIVLAGPLAGALVDRWDRRRVMMAADAGVALVTLGLLGLHLAADLEAWYLYVAKLLVGLCLAFQTPAYLAIVTVLLPKEQYSRASGLLSLALSSSWVVAPPLAAVGLGAIGLAGILVVDLVTFALAILALLVAKIPALPRSASDGVTPSLWRDALFGFVYIWQRPGLRSLQGLLFFSNLFAMFGILLAPMILARTGSSEVILGSVQSVGALGGVLGGAFASAWTGFRKRIHGVLLSLMAIGLLGQVLMGIGQTVVVWSIAAFLASFFYPLFLAANQAIWQAKIAVEIQGRVFAARRLIAEAAGPLTMVVAGPLADQVFEPALMPEGKLVLASWLVGTGPGAGMALMYVLSGLLGAATALAGYAFKAVREIDDSVPDCDDSQPILRA